MMTCLPGMQKLKIYNGNYFSSLTCIRLEDKTLLQYIAEQVFVIIIVLWWHHL